RSTHRQAVHDHAMDRHHQVSRPSAGAYFSRLVTSPALPAPAEERNDDPPPVIMKFSRCQDHDKKVIDASFTCSG
ncbi:MAG: hypothetical protein J2P17_25360, partial [Mycobacterium sp.]|nr:hypothetical protein [Mycobacterium sp.]